MEFKITLNNQEFTVWSTTVRGAIKKASVEYGNIENNPWWEGYPIVNNENCNIYTFCSGWTGRKRKFMR